MLQALRSPFSAHHKAQKTVPAMAAVAAVAAELGC